MKLVLLTALLVCLTLGATNDVEGHWEVKCPGGVQYITVADASFDFRIDGHTLTGAANIGNGWPGKGQISDGKLDGEHISFTLIADYSGMMMGFTGTVHGDEIKLTMKLPDAGQTEFEGKKTARK